jgi:hypothetical protein
VCEDCGLPPELCTCWLDDDATAGALERTNPLPAGRYWVDVFQPDAEAFGAWLSSNKATVHVVSTQSFEKNDGGPPRDWYLFQVSAPTPWQGPGFPTIADASVTSSADTAQRPDPAPDPVSQLADASSDLFSSVHSAATALPMVAVIAAGVGVAILIARSGR